MSDWQPIETAPKDGTEIDLWIVSLQGPAKGDGWRAANSWWVGEKIVDYFSYQTRSGWVGVSSLDYDRMPDWVDEPGEWEATHWMEIPPPPNAP